MRDCENCKHRVMKVEVGKGTSPEHFWGCECWKCEFEPTTKNYLAIDCISRQAVIDLMMQKWGENFSGDSAMQESIDAIREMPSVTPQEPVLDKIRAEIEQQEKWLMDAGYNQYNVDIALNSIKFAVDKNKAESEE